MNKTCGRRIPVVWTRRPPLQVVTIIIFGMVAPESFDHPAGKSVVQ
ncbi:MAG: hypothetical protein H0V88_15580 [Pyrinomonadaceae bacterium]|nr:hypothetical protein [Pyrinomonadaceae bacterium]